MRNLNPERALHLQVILSSNIIAIFVNTSTIYQHVMRQLKIAKNILSRESVSLDDYLQREPTTTFEEEQELVRRIKEGDTEALDILIESYRECVEGLAEQYQNKGLALPDLIGAGNKGVTKGVETFDENKGYLFRSWITWSIRQSIVEVLRSQK